MDQPGQVFPSIENDASEQHTWGSLLNSLQHMLVVRTCLTSDTLAARGWNRKRKRVENQPNHAWCLPEHWQSCHYVLQHCPVLRSGDCPNLWNDVTQRKSKKRNKQTQRHIFQAVKSKILDDVYNVMDVDRCRNGECIIEYRKQKWEYVRQLGSIASIVRFIFSDNLYSR